MCVLLSWSIFLIFFSPEYIILMLSGPCLFESAYPEPIFRDSSSLNMNAPSDKEYVSIITLFWSLGNYTVYWYESDTFFFFFVIMIIVLLPRAIREDLFLPNGKKNVWSYSYPLTWQHSHPILNVIDPSNIIFFLPDINFHWSCVLPPYPYHPVSEILSHHNSHAYYYKTFNARFLY